MIDSTGAVFGISTVSLHVTSKSSTKGFLHKQSLRYSPILQSLSHSEVPVTEFQT